MNVYQFTKGPQPLVTIFSPCKRYSTCRRMYYRIIRKLRLH